MDKCFCRRNLQTTFNKGNYITFIENKEYDYNYIHNINNGFSHYVVYLETFVNEIFSESSFNKHFMKLAEFREKRIDSILSNL
jgi:hypothetical protein